MFYFLHNFQPENILIEIGPVNVYWYGLFVVFGMLFGIIVILKLADIYGVSKDMLIDLIFWMIIGGVAGARAYDVLLNIEYYSRNMIDALKVWQGGLAIHGAIIGSLLVLYIFARRYKLDFWLVAALIVPGASLGQAIGRWGNYFNQELFGKPTELPWGIPITLINRPLEYFSQTYFHPVFLYESLGNLAIFIILLLMHKAKSRSMVSFKMIAASYLLLYSILRFFMEYIRVDPAPVFFALKLPQLVSLALIFGAVFIIYGDWRSAKKTKTAE